MIVKFRQVDLLEKSFNLLPGAVSMADPYFANCPAAVSAVPDQIVAKIPPTIVDFTAKSTITHLVSQTATGPASPIHFEFLLIHLEYLEASLTRPLIFPLFERFRCFDIGKCYGYPSRYFNF